MPVRVDLSGLLLALSKLNAAGNGGPLGFVVSQSGVRLSSEELLEHVQAAMAEADEAAELRYPPDPTNGTEGDLVGAEVWGHLLEGLFTDEEVSTWFEDLAQALEINDTEIAVAPLSLDTRVPRTDDWLEMSPAITAFLSFIPKMDGRVREVPDRVVEEVADQLAEWCGIPDAILVINRGFAEFAVPPAAAATEMRVSAKLDPTHRVSALLANPRRSHAINFGSSARSFLQVIDATRPLTSTLLDLLEPLRILAPYLEYAWVRPAMNLVADPGDIPAVLERDSTRIESVGSGRPELLREHVLDACVAQVLTDEHLSRASNLSSYDVEELPNGRYLAVARDPHAWLDDLNPEPEVLDQARAEFGEALLTENIIDSYLDGLSGG